MGTLTSDHDHTGLIINGITLGSPARDYAEDETPIPGSPYKWDDIRIPHGTIDEHGQVTIIVEGDP